MLDNSPALMLQNHGLSEHEPRCRFAKFSRDGFDCRTAATILPIFEIDKGVYLEVPERHRSDAMAPGNLSRTGFKATSSFPIARKDQSQVDAFAFSEARFDSEIEVKRTHWQWEILKGYLTPVAHITVISYSSNRTISCASVPLGPRLTTLQALVKRNLNIYEAPLEMPSFFDQIMCPLSESWFLLALISHGFVFSSGEGISNPHGG